MYKKILKNIVEKLDFNNLKINQNVYHGIFVCGGGLDNNKNILEKNHRNKSLRQIFCDEYTKSNNIDINNIILVEKIENYQNKKTKYNNLIILESEIANIASIILIFLEAPGSLVELGLFCNENYREKLFLVIPGKHQNKKTFIHLGAIKYIKSIKPKEKNKNIYYYPQDDQEGNYRSDYMKNIIRSIDDKLKSQKDKEIEFNINNTGHIALLIYKIIDLFYPILFEEIEYILNTIGLKINKKNIKRQIHLLKELKLINIENFCTEEYYYPIKDDLQIINFKIKPPSDCNDLKDYYNKKNNTEIYLSIKQNIAILFKKEPLPERKDLKKQIISKKIQNAKYFIKDICTYILISEEFLIKFANTSPHRYKVYEIAKSSGKGMRIIANPSKELKFIQKFIIKKLAENNKIKIHENAYAYKENLSIKNNAQVHVKNQYLLKMDFKDFFPSIIPDLLFLILEKMGIVLDNENKKLLNNLLFCKISKENDRLELSIGAPSSPFISNVIMYFFDEKISEYCTKENIKYSRYADDLTFSTNIENKLCTIPRIVKKILKNEEYNYFLRINDKKTIFSSKKHNRHVTGIVLTNEGKLSIGRERKRIIISKIHKSLLGKLDDKETKKLIGEMSFVLHIEKDFSSRVYKKYSSKYSKDEINKLIPKKYRECYYL